MSGTLFLLLAVVALVGGFLMRSRVRKTLEGREPMTDDPVLRDILAQSDTWEADEGEPLDEDEIREAEDRFWEQEWDRPEDWRG